MHIATVCNLPAPYGGAEVFARSLMLKLASMGQQISVVTHSLFETQACEDQTTLRYTHREDCDFLSLEPEFQIHPLFVTSLTPSSHGHDPRFDRELRSLWSQHRPDIVHCHFTTGVARFVTQVCKDLDIPVVMTLHGMTNLTPVPDSFVRAGLSPAEVLELLDHCDCVVVVSNEMLQHCEKRGVNNVLQIPTGVDTSYFTPDSGANRSHLLYVGKRNRQKGLRETIAAYLEVAHETEQGLNLVGRGIDYPGFAATGFGLSPAERKRGASMIADGRISLFGEIPCSDVRQLYRRASALLLPSWTEGFPLVVLESLACGTPIVASRVGAIPEIVEDGVNGYCVTVGNVGQLSEKILRLLGHRDTGLEARCRSHGSRYDISRAADSYLALFKSICKIRHLRGLPAAR